MKENCAECKHHDVFWGGSGCNLLNNGERCKFEPKVMNNADRIRSMSDFELAKEIENAQSGISIKNQKNLDYFDCILEWLQQPAEGE